MGCNIAIDGPAGAGKSTIAKRVAKELSFIYVDTGAMYRAVALYLLRNEIDGTDAEAVAGNCQSAEVSIRYENGEQVVILNGENVNQYIRTEEVGNMASKTSANPAVRAHLLNLQRNLAAKNDVVMDGRDIGTVVLPDAQVKIYLTASVETRAKRRYDEYLAKGESADLEEIKKDIENRDHQDMTREISPLRQAEDAVLVDSSLMNIDEVVAAILGIYKDRWNKPWSKKLQKTAGFCFGVQRAVDKVYELIDSCPDRLFTLGPIIHNEEVVNDLEKKGVRVASEEELKTLPEGSTVVIRSHGVGKKVYDQLEECGLSYVDVTCPFVLKIHRIVEKESKAGSHIVIIGDPDHPEVVGICGWCIGSYTVIRTKQDALDFVPPESKMCVLCRRPHLIIINLKI